MKYLPFIKCVVYRRNKRNVAYTLCDRFNLINTFLTRRTYLYAVYLTLRFKSMCKAYKFKLT